MNSIFGKEYEAWFNQNLFNPEYDNSGVDEIFTKPFKSSSVFVKSFLSDIFFLYDFKYVSDSECGCHFHVTPAFKFRRVDYVLLGIISLAFTSYFSSLDGKNRKNFFEWNEKLINHNTNERCYYVVTGTGTRHKTPHIEVRCFEHLFIPSLLAYQTFVLLKDCFNEVYKRDVEYFTKNIYEDWDCCIKKYEKYENLNRIIDKLEKLGFLNQRKKNEYVFNKSFVFSHIDYYYKSFIQNSKIKISKNDFVSILNVYFQNNVLDIVEKEEFYFVFIETFKNKYLKTTAKSVFPYGLINNNISIQELIKELKK